MPRLHYYLSFAHHFQVESRSQEQQERARHFEGTQEKEMAILGDQSLGDRSEIQLIGE